MYVRTSEDGPYILFSHCLQTLWWIRQNLFVSLSLSLSISLLFSNLCVHVFKFIRQGSSTNDKIQICLFSDLPRPCLTAYIQNMLRCMDTSEAGPYIGAPRYGCRGTLRWALMWVFFRLPMNSLMATFVPSPFWVQLNSHNVSCYRSKKE